MVISATLLVLFGLGIFVYMKFIKNKQNIKGKDDLEDYDYGEDENDDDELEWENEDEENTDDEGSAE